MFVADHTSAHHVFNSLLCPDDNSLMCRWDFWNEHEEWMGGESCEYCFQCLLIFLMICNLWLVTAEPDCMSVPAGCVHLGNIWQYSWSCAAVSRHHLVCSLEAFVVHSRCHFLQQWLAKVTPFKLKNGCSLRRLPLSLVP